MGPAWNAWPSRHATQRRQVLQQSLRFAHDRYEAGHASDLEELDAQRNLYAAELEVVRLPGPAMKARYSYYGVHAEGQPPGPAARVFIDWLLGQAHDERTPIPALPDSLLGRTPTVG